MDLCHPVTLIYDVAVHRCTVQVGTPTYTGEGVLTKDVESKISVMMCVQSPSGFVYEVVDLPAINKYF